MSFEQAVSDFTCLQILRERIQSDTANAGWYMHCAYKLGKGCSVDEALELPPKPTKPTLTVVRS